MVHLSIVIEVPSGVDPSHAMESLEIIDEETGATTVTGLVAIRQAVTNKWKSFKGIGGGLTDMSSERIVAARLGCVAERESARVRCATGVSPKTDHH
jgi:hypothetical protein